MSRPQKSRRICSLPENTSFGPKGDSSLGSEPVSMTVDEFEAIRLIDLLEMNQVECAEHMAIARTTAQSIYNSARKKLAECLVNGVELIVEGGEYNVCNGSSECACKDCSKKK